MAAHDEVVRRFEGAPEECLAAGMGDYVSKPVAPKDLATTLQKWLPAAGHPAAESTPPPCVGWPPAALTRPPAASTTRY
jgi:hypothetical protein